MPVPPPAPPDKRPPLVSGWYLDAPFRLKEFQVIVEAQRRIKEAKEGKKDDKLARGSEIVTPGTSPVPLPYTRLSADAC